MWQVRGPNLDSSLLPNGLGGKIGREKKEKRERKRVCRERVSNFSLDFLAIGLSVPDEPRGKVALRCKGYAWVSILWSFNKLREVGVFSYLVYFRLKSH